jgi:hypothetical protein
MTSYYGQDSYEKALFKVEPEGAEIGQWRWSAAQGKWVAAPAFDMAGVDYSLITEAEAKAKYPEAVNGAA